MKTTLKDFYNNHFKEEGMIEWEELDEWQIKSLENSLTWQRFQLREAVNELKRAFINDFKRLFDKIKNIIP